jgi:hypothetical protein
MVLFPVVGIPLYFATGLFHVTAIFAPVLFLGWMAIPAGFIFYYLFRNNINAEVKRRLSTIASRDWKTFTPKRLIVSVKVYGFHFFKMFIPGITLMNYPTLFMWGVTKEGNDDAYAFNFDFFVGCMALASSAGLMLAVHADYRVYAVFLILATLQWCAIIPATQLLADRYVSTAMPFMMFFVAYFLPWQVCLALTGFYIARLWDTMDMFTSIWHYYKYQIYHAPQITTPRKDLINYCINMGDHLSAWHHTREGLMLTPNDFSLLHRAAICAKACGSMTQSMEYLAKAEQNLYIDQEETQLAWVKRFKEDMKKQAMAQSGVKHKKK